MKRFNDDPETSMPAHAPDRGPADRASAPADSDTLLDAAPPPPADPVGPLAAPARLRADHHRAGADVLGGTGPAPALSWEVPAAPAGWTQARAEVEITRGPLASATTTETVALNGPS